MKRPPEYFWLPDPERECGGCCYHAKRCGAHVLVPVPREDALWRILNEKLRPCGNCVEHHDLNPVFEAIL